MTNLWPKQNFFNPMGGHILGLDPNNRIQAICSLLLLLQEWINFWRLEATFIQTLKPQKVILGIIIQKRAHIMHQKMSPAKFPSSAWCKTCFLNQIWASIWAIIAVITLLQGNPSSFTNWPFLAFWCQIASKLIK